MRINFSMGLALLAILFTALATGNMYGTEFEGVGIAFIVATWFAASRGN